MQMKSLNGRINVIYTTRTGNSTIFWGNHDLDGKRAYELRLCTSPVLQLGAYGIQLEWRYLFALIWFSGRWSGECVYMCTRIGVQDSHACSIWAPWTDQSPSEVCLLTSWLVNLGSVQASSGDRSVHGAQFLFQLTSNSKDWHSLWTG